MRYRWALHYRWIPWSEVPLQYVPNMASSIVAMLVAVKKTFGIAKVERSLQRFANLFANLVLFASYCKRLQHICIIANDLHPR